MFSLHVLHVFLALGQRGYGIICAFNRFCCLAVHGGISPGLCILSVMHARSALSADNLGPRFSFFCFVACMILLFIPWWELATRVDMNSITPWLDKVLAIYRHRYQMHRCYQRSIILKLDDSYAPQSTLNDHTQFSFSSASTKYVALPHGNTPWTRRSSPSSPPQPNRNSYNCQKPCCTTDRDAYYCSLVQRGRL